MIPVLVEAGKNLKNVAAIKNQMMFSKFKKLSAENFIPPFISSVLAALAFSRLSLGLFAWFALVPLFLGFNNKTRRQRLILMFVFAFFFFLFTLYWVAHVTLIGLICLCLFLAFEFSFFGFLIPKRLSAFSLLLVPGLWIIFEKFRGFLFFGFGWGYLGYTQYKNLHLIQIADMFSVLGVSFLIVLVNVSLSCLFLGRLKNPSRKIAVILPFILVVFSYSYGVFALNKNYQDLNLKVSLVQANIPQEQKWDPLHSEDIMEKHSSLTLKAKNQENPDLVIWPETSVPAYLLDEAKFYIKVSKLAKKLNSYLLVGSPREDYKLKRFYNTAFLFDAKGQLQLFHDKIHLVPFGEYIPYKNIFFFLNNTPIADFSPGAKHTIFKVTNSSNKTFRFGVLICFEDVFPSLVKEFKDNGADFLVTITNEAWFKKSSEPAQHTAISVFRAIENRCWFLRCANTGVSCFIDPTGKIRKRVQRNRKDIFVQGSATMVLEN